MATYNIRHACGHSSTANITGPEHLRSGKAAAMTNEPCEACRLAAADAQAEKLQLPPLRGSDRQVAWAADIRQAILSWKPAFDWATARSVEDATKLASVMSAMKTPYANILIDTCASCAPHPTNPDAYDFHLPKAVKNASMALAELTAKTAQIDIEDALAVVTEALTAYADHIFAELDAVWEAERNASANK